MLALVGAERSDSTYIFNLRREALIRTSNLTQELVQFLPAEHATFSTFKHDRTGLFLNRNLSHHTAQTVGRSAQCRTRRTYSYRCWNRRCPFREDFGNWKLAAACWWLTTTDLRELTYCRLWCLTFGVGALSLRYGFFL